MPTGAALQADPSIRGRFSFNSFQCRLPRGCLFMALPTWGLRICLESAPQDTKLATGTTEAFRYLKYVTP